MMFAFRHADTNDKRQANDTTDAPCLRVKFLVKHGWCKGVPGVCLCRKETNGVEITKIVAENSDSLQPVYEADEAAILGQRLVLTPYMLLDKLRQCQEETEALLLYVHHNGVGVETRCGLPVNPVAERLEQVHFSVSQILKLLWRSGLWTEEELEAASDTSGKAYHALRAPFTDGKPHGRPLPEDAPYWQRELLGLEAEDAPATTAHVPTLGAK
jgi:hypothetical protein